MSIQDRTAAFRRLHAAGELLVLPNAWDPVSARLVETLGATAIATTSAGLCWAHGYPLLKEGRYQEMYAGPVTYPEMNALFQG